MNKATDTKDKAIEEAKGGGLSQIINSIEWGDGILFLIFCAFLLFSALFVSSADTRAVHSVNYLGYIAFAAITCLSIVQLPSWWFAMQKYLFRAVIILLIMAGLTLVIGSRINGATRWLSLGFISIQPSEFLKVVIITLGALAGIEHRIIRQRGGSYWSWDGTIFTTRNFLRKDDGSLRFDFGFFKIDNKWFTLLNLYFFVCLGIFLLFVGQNLSMTLIYIPLLWLYPFLFDLDFETLWKKIKIPVIGGIIALIFALILGMMFNGNVLSQEAKKSIMEMPMLGRVPTAINRLISASESDQIDYHHLEQKDLGLIALCRKPFAAPDPGSSLLRGKLAQSESDYILSFIIEEYSVIFLFIILALYAGFIGRMLYLVKTYSDENVPLMRYLFHGFILLLLLEIIVHLVVNANIIVTGQSLPFISKGGSSLLAHSILLGILLNICRQAKAKKQAQMEQAKA